ncbi:MAG: glycosyltransferase family 2 protein [Desulfurococcales archaeon]|nr:glycosyltransferase family 2 protein [Desulfurococcales archaeon]
MGEEKIDLTVVLPTYNEAENIKDIIERLVSVLEDAGITGFEILVVDDNSPDGTCLIVREMALKDSRIRCLLRRRNRGLSTAIMRGIHWARGKYVVVMDADFQHPPELVPILYMKAVKTGADVVVATRYARGGGVEGWSRKRLLMSKLANLTAHVLVPPTRKTSDPMSGFFLVRKDRIRLETLKPRGYKILMEILARHPWLRVEEVPYVFRSRVRGKSKLGAKTVVDFLIHAASLSRMVRFGLVGLLGALLNLLVMTGSLLAGAPLDVASILGIEAGLLFNFAFHERWTFETRMRGNWKSRLLGYHAASAGGMAATYTAMKLLVVAGLASPIVGQAVGIAAGFGVNYGLSAGKVWRRREIAGGRVQEARRGDKKLY